MEACDHLPDVVEGQCREFVETYGNAFIALLAQEIDPSLVSIGSMVYIFHIRHCKEEIYKCFWCVFQNMTVSKT
jgi:hypothetical protein